MLGLILPSTTVTAASWSGSEGTLEQLLHQELLHNAIAVEYPHHTLTGTSTHSSHSGSMLYETYVAHQRNLAVYH